MVSEITTKNMNAETASRLKEARENLGMTQEKFGKSIGLRWFSIRDMEAGKKIVTVDMAQKLEKIYSIDFRWLLTGEGEMFTASRPVEVVSGDPRVAAIAGLLADMTDEERDEAYKYISEKKRQADTEKRMAEMERMIAELKEIRAG
ncbi:MAG: helix-turn-helix transcriptional regulator [Synergistaceae bacterium]|jgi:DNA-binding XRE family transcriptional regulator|nr:helix-turn-helix transcriptional regulator [Synergistaceae bacterium]